MATFNRFDICEAFACLEWDYNAGGWLRERPSNRRRREATSVQLARVGFAPRPTLSFDTLTPNGKAIYRALVLQYGFVTRAANCRHFIEVNGCQLTIAEFAFKHGLTWERVFRRLTSGWPVEDLALPPKQGQMRGIKRTRGAKS